MEIPILLNYRYNKRRVEIKKQSRLFSRRTPQNTKKRKHEINKM